MGTPSDQARKNPLPLLGRGRPLRQQGIGGPSSKGWTNVRESGRRLPSLVTRGRLQHELGMNRAMEDGKTPKSVPSPSIRRGHRGCPAVHRAHGLATWADAELRDGSRPIPRNAAIQPHKGGSRTASTIKSIKRARQPTRQPIKRAHNRNKPNKPTPNQSPSPKSQKSQFRQQPTRILTIIPNPAHPSSTHSMQHPKTIYLANPYGFSEQQRSMLLPLFVEVLESLGLEVWEPLERNNQGSTLDPGLGVSHRPGGPSATLQMPMPSSQSSTGYHPMRA